MLTQKKLKEILHYDSCTGIFIWKIRTSNRIQIGSEAGSINCDGYRIIGIERKTYLAHRLAWLFVYGYFPEYIVDHRDRIQHHNWILNLREVSQVCNMRNYGNREDNSSGVKGVCWDKRRNRWEVSLTINQKTKHLGRYVNFDNAVCARLAGEQCIEWSECGTFSPAHQYVKNNIIKR